MKNFKHLLLLMFLGSIVLTGFAQVVSEDPNDYRERDQQSLQDFQEGNIAFPPKPRNQISIGIKGGLSTVAGDVAPQADGGFALNVRKALGHAFSVRLHAGLGRATGLNYQPAKGYAFHANPWDVEYRRPDGVAENVFYNYQMRYGDIGVEGVINLNNINFYKETNKWNIYAALGFGAMGYNVRVDALNGSGQIYEFGSVEAIDLNQGDALGIEGRRERIDALKGILDGEYESLAEGHADEQGFTVGGDPYVINPYISGAIGLRYRVASRVELELEHRFVRTNDDLMDGQRWQESGGGPNFGSAMTRDMDMYNLTSLGIHFRLGKGVESLWWQNPVSGIYSDIADTKKLVNSLTEDTDGDGVPDLYDKEPDTPEGSPVDPSGRALDSDRDGIPDTEDAEPFSNPGVDVDGNGRALDSDNDGVPDAFDKEPNSPPGMYYDAKGVAIVFPEQPKSDDACLLPIIYFDLDRDNIKPEFYPELYYIAQVMRNNTDLKVSAIGHTDNRNSDSYNQDLSMRRVNNAVDFLVNTYGIDRDRFVTAYKGEDIPQIGDLPDNHRNRKLESLHYVNRRVEFECIE
ncbi:MAG: OmpA family protein [Bacteroidota bacterium]